MRTMVPVLFTDMFGHKGQYYLYGTEGSQIETKWETEFGDKGTAPTFDAARLAARAALKLHWKKKA